MSSALYVSMFATSVETKQDRRRARRRKIAEAVLKAGIYCGAIASFAFAADNPLQYASVVSSICVALECFR
jgi:hypothetical protein